MIAPPPSDEPKDEINDGKTEENTTPKIADAGEASGNETIGNDTEADGNSTGNERSSPE